MVDLNDATNLLASADSDEIYNLGAKQVKVSFETPEDTANSEAMGRENARRFVLGFGKRRVSISLDSEIMEGQKRRKRQPAVLSSSPYGAAKLYAYVTVITALIRH